MLAVLMVAAFCLSFFALPAMAEEKKGGVEKPAAGSPGAPRLPARIPRSDFSMIFGTISKIDNSDPANPKIQVTSEMDSKTHEVAVTQWTNVTKMTYFADLKTGDTVRVMVRKIQDKEVAVNIMYGKIRPPMMRQPAKPVVQAEKQPKK